MYLKMMSLESTKYALIAVSLAMLIGAGIGAYIVHIHSNRIILELEQKHKDELLHQNDSLVQSIHSRKAEIDSLLNQIAADSALINTMEQDIIVNQKEVKRLKSLVPKMTTSEKVNWIHTRYDKP